MIKNCVMAVECAVMKEEYRNVSKILMSVVATAECDRARRKGTLMFFQQELVCRAQGLVMCRHIVGHVHRGYQGFNRTFIRFFNYLS